MNNEEIILDVAVSVYGEAAVNEMLACGEDVPLHTLKGWQNRGPFRIKKGEHGLQVKLWKLKKNKYNETDEPAREFFLAKAYLFRGDQVELEAKGK